MSSSVAGVERSTNGTPLSRERGRERPIASPCRRRRRLGFLARAPVLYHLRASGGEISRAVVEVIPIIPRYPAPITRHDTPSTNGYLVEDAARANHDEIHVRKDMKLGGGGGERSRRRAETLEASEPPGRCRRRSSPKTRPRTLAPPGPASTAISEGRIERPVHRVSRRRRSRARRGIRTVSSPSRPILPAPLAPRNGCYTPRPPRMLFATIQTRLLDIPGRQR